MRSPRKQIWQGHSSIRLRGPDPRQPGSIRKAVLRQRLVSVRPLRSHSRTIRLRQVARAFIEILFRVTPDHAA
jgi:hypothetical protein